MKSSNRTALITGGARRIGNEIARTLHDAGLNIMVHYRSSAQAADALVAELNEVRADSAATVQGDLHAIEIIPRLVDDTITSFGRLDVLVNNASTFYPTPIELLEDEFWKDLVGSNLKAPAFLIKAATPHLRESGGCVVNIVDIYAQRPLSDHPIYCSAKAGLEMLTKSLARDLAPQIRVNGVAPGAILLPENDNAELSQAQLLERIPMARMGHPADIAKTVKFLVFDGDYITGQIIAVDGGRSVMI
ncbi:MAG: pteridine reductase [Arenicella sp.]|nr:pteridine reductase [Arenicella sp.]